jgi:hypothetical protein
MRLLLPVNLILYFRNVVALIIILNRSLGLGLKRKQFFHCREKRKLSEKERILENVFAKVLVLAKIFFKSFHFRSSFRAK